MTFRTVVVGYGSIGARHARLLEELGCTAAVVSRRDIPWGRSYTELAAALDREDPDYVVIANRTGEHLSTLVALAGCGYRHRVLVEKPLFASLCVVPSHSFSGAYVAYNFRFHPAIARLRDLIRDERVVSAQVYVGQYLPDWRPGTDYRQSYSTRTSEGGGALRDLSHELDYVRWMFGGWSRLTALGGRYGDLDIDTDDAYTVLIETPRCPMVTVQMNYLDRVGRRDILVTTAAHTFHVDLVSGRLCVDRAAAEDCSVPRDFTYRAQHEAVLRGTVGALATLDDGFEVLRMIDAAERAAHGGMWVASQ